MEHYFVRPYLALVSWHFRDISDSMKCIILATNSTTPKCQPLQGLLSPNLMEFVGEIGLSYEYCENICLIITTAASHNTS